MYKFNPESAYNTIANHYLQWVTANHCPKKVVIGISGGKDSSVVAAIFTKLLGADNVIGVSMPCNGQKDMADVDKVFAHLGIKRLTIDIGDAFDSIIHGVENNAVDVHYDTKTNLPARLRMSTLYAIAQSVGGIVTNNCNLSEDCCSYSTIFGDCAGSYAPIQGLTVTEVIALGDWLGLPYELTHKTPIDGLQPLSDEDKLGFTYAQLDKFIRENEGTDEFKQMIVKKYLSGKFKLDIVRIPQPKFDYPNFVFSH